MVKNHEKEKISSKKKENEEILICSEKKMSTTPPDNKYNTNSNINIIKGYEIFPVVFKEEQPMIFKKERLIGICPRCGSIFSTTYEFEEIDVEILDREEAKIYHERRHVAKLLVIQCTKCRRLVNLIPESKRLMMVESI